MIQGKLQKVFQDQFHLFRLLLQDLKQEQLSLSILRKKRIQNNCLMQNNGSRQHESKFFNGFLLGLIVGGAIVFILATKKGKKILKLISEEGLDNLSNILEKYEEKDEEKTKSKEKVKIAKILDQKDQGDEIEETEEFEEEVSKEEEEEKKPRKARRFFKRSK